MINGIVVGIVVDNVDPDKMGRVKVNFPVDGETPPESTWVRMIWPMAGKLRGWVILPDVGTEVVVGYAYRTMSPYVLGAVYNGGDDKPKVYANEDGNDDHRRFWS
ncbi:MAG: phage baseplate assembly protein V, partial [Myxococcota bacterium]